MPRNGACARDATVTVHAALLALILFIGGCTTAITGTPVTTPRVLADAAAYRACARAVARVERDIDGLLDTMPSGTATPDRTAIGTVYGRMTISLESGCGYWPAQGDPLSAIVLYLAQQRSSRTGAALAATALMITSICASVETAIDSYGVNLTPEAHSVCLEV